MARLFGFEFKRAVETPEIEAPSFSPRQTDDGAVTIAAGGSYGTYVDLDGTIRSEAELVTKYREMSMQPEIDAAVDEIVNEAISIEEEEIVSIIMDNLAISDKIKKAIREEFQTVLNLIDFQNKAYDIFRRWYIDGRLYYHVIIDEKNLKAGIKEVRYVDPRKIRKVREVAKKRVPGGDSGESVVPITQNEYYIFSERGFNFGNKISGPTTTGLKIARDSVVHITSGLTDSNGSLVLSYMHKAIKAMNQLRTLEDALVIYRLARAPERRIWYIDVGNLPKMKAEQYVQEIIIKHKNRLVYDASTGEVRDDRKFMTMLEDFWLPRREGGKGTEVTTLPGGQSLGEMDDVLFFQKKLYQTLNVPVNRLNSDALFSIGRATEVTRDEIKFSKFIARLRNRFSMLFNKFLERQVVLKGIMSLEDWEAIQADIRYDFAKDGYFMELKNNEILQNRFNTVALMDQSMLTGRYYSNSWVRRNILQQDEDLIEEMDKEIEEEMNDPRWQPQQQQMQGQDDGSGMMPGQPQMPGQDQQQINGGQAQDADMVLPQQDTPDDTQERIRQAKIDALWLGRKKTRTSAEESKYRSAKEILAKHKQG